MHDWTWGSCSPLKSQQIIQHICFYIAGLRAGGKEWSLVETVYLWDIKKLFRHSLLTPIQRGWLSVHVLLPPAVYKTTYHLKFSKYKLTIALRDLVYEGAFTAFCSCAVSLQIYTFLQKCQKYAADMAPIRLRSIDKTLWHRQTIFTVAEPLYKHSFIHNQSDKVKAVHSIPGYFTSEKFLPVATSFHCFSSFQRMKHLLSGNLIQGKVGLSL